MENHTEFNVLTTRRARPRALCFTPGYLRVAAGVLLAFSLHLGSNAQAPGGPPPFGPGGFFPGGPGGPPGGPGQQPIEIATQFDKDADGRLDAAERKAAREHLSKQRQGQFGPRRMPGGLGRGGPGFGGRAESIEPVKPGPRIAPADVETFPKTPFYENGVLRTLFLEFENADWEAELADFINTDVEVPATLTVDGTSFPDVGIRFRGQSSLMMVGEGRKRSFNLTVDHVHKNQAVGGYRTLNLLNSNDDPTFLRSVLFYKIAREYIPAPLANLVRVVINGESWGIYINVQQINKDFLKEWFGTTKGARWKVPGSPGGRGGLAYLGDDPALYRRSYEIKSKDDPKAWADLIRLCKVLNETPAQELEKALAPILDIDGALKFLALDNAFINNDGYWIRASDYYICQDPAGRFRLIPYDANETFSLPGGPGFGGRGGFGGRSEGDRRPGPGGFPGTPPPQQEQGSFGPRQASVGPGAPERGAQDGPRSGTPRTAGPDLDPLVAANDSNKPLLSKLLEVPELRERYLGYIREMSEAWLQWETLEPLVRKSQALIDADVKSDTRKLYSYDAFIDGIESDQPAIGPRQRISLKSFAEQRRKFLLDHPAVGKAR
jgi:hypothetical protein